VTTESPVRQSDAVYEQLRSDIIEWRLAPGEVLAEVELTERFAVSRTPLREALQRLAREGLISTQHGRGATVAALSLDEIVQLVQWREALEPYAVRLCARSLDRSRFVELDAELHRCQQALAADGTGDAYAGYFDLISRFDDAIGDACGNRHLASSLLELRGHLYRIRRLARRSPTRMLATTDEHLAICRAICAGDERAAVRATAIHIEHSFASVLESLRGEIVGPDELSAMAASSLVVLGAAHG